MTEAIAAKTEAALCNSPKGSPDSKSPRRSKRARKAKKDDNFTSGADYSHKTSDESDDSTKAIKRTRNLIMVLFNLIIDLEMEGALSGKNSRKNTLIGRFPRKKLFRQK